MESKKRSTLASLFGFVFLVIAAFFLSLIFSILIEWIGIYFAWWQQPGSLHAKSVLAQELIWLHGDFGGLVVKPADLSSVFLGQFDEWVVQSPVMAAVIEFVGPSSPLVHYIAAMILVTQTALVRLTVIIMALPALVLFVIFALIDGLSERDVRTWSGGRETSFVYHHAKAFIVPFMVLPVALYLSLPISIHPSIFMVFFALPASLTVWLSAKYFKKYL